MSALVDWFARSIWSTLGVVVVLGVAAIAAGRAFGLTTVGSTGLYFIVWWMVLFTILPIRIKTQHDLGSVISGTEPGAPASPALRERAIWTSIVSGVVFVGISALSPLAGL